jgi:undecaprenyl-phosphate galactose phosphotransferase
MSKPATGIPMGAGATPHRSQRLGWNIPQLLEGIILLCVDLVTAFFAFVLGSNYKPLGVLAGSPPSLDIWLGSPIASHLIFYIPAIMVLLYLSWERGVYLRPYPFWDFIRQSLRAVIIACLIELFLLAYLSNALIDRRSVFFTWVLLAVLMPTTRILAKRVLIGTSLSLRPVLIVGTGRNACSAYRALEENKFLGYQVIGFASRDAASSPDSRTLNIGDKRFHVHILGEAVSSRLQELGRPTVAVALESLASEEELVRALGSASRSVIVFPDIRGLPLGGMEVSHFFSHDLLMFRLRNNLGRRGMRLMKQVFDLLLAVIFIVGLSWFFLLIAILIGRSGRPVIYGHDRVGQNGVIFRCYKFRTMVPDAEERLRELLERDPDAAAEWAQDFKLKDDPRITRIGHFLRTTSLDELPQLFNVLKGEMSLVGPRPVVPDELKRYGDYASYYLQCKPGITGVWQVSGRNDTTYEDRVNMDAWYARNWSLWYDLVILLKTVAVVFGRHGAY